MATLKINGVSFSPSEMDIGIQDVSSPDSGRDQGATMQKNRITQKYKISLSWWCPTPQLTAQILTAVDPEYFPVQFTDPKTNTLKTKIFYCGDRSAPVKFWSTNKKRYSKVSFNITER